MSELSPVFESQIRPQVSHECVDDSGMMVGRICVASFLFCHRVKVSLLEGVSGNKAEFSPVTPISGYCFPVIYIGISQAMRCNLSWSL